MVVPELKPLDYLRYIHTAPEENFTFEQDEFNHLVARLSSLAFENPRELLGTVFPPDQENLLKTCFSAMIGKLSFRSIDPFIEEENFTNRVDLSYLWDDETPFWRLSCNYVRDDNDTILGIDGVSFRFFAGSESGEDRLVGFLFGLFPEYPEFGSGLIIYDYDPDELDDEIINGVGFSFNNPAVPFKFGEGLEENYAHDLSGGINRMTAAMMHFIASDDLGAFDKISK